MKSTASGNQPINVRLDRLNNNPRHDLKTLTPIQQLNSDSEKPKLCCREAQSPSDHQKHEKKGKNSNPAPYAVKPKPENGRLQLCAIGDEADADDA